MTYLLKPNRKKNRFPLIIASVVVIVLVVVQLLFPHFYILALSKIGLPILQSEGILGRALATIAHGLSSKQSLAEENRLLQTQIAELQLDHDQNVLLSTENAELKKLLGRSATTTPTILATVLARPPYTPYDSMILDIGSDAHIARGDRLLAYNRVPIGTVSEVYDHFSKGVLYSTAGQSIEVVIGTSTTATAEALGGGSFKVKVPREVGVSIGDPVALPSIKAEIFGTIQKIDMGEGDAFKYLFFDNPVSLSELRWVQVEASLVP